MADDDRSRLVTLLSHAGFTPSESDLEEMLKIFRVNQGRLQRLHAADLDDEEVAGAFTADATEVGR